MKIHIKESELIQIIDQVLNEQEYSQGNVGLGGGATSTDSSGSFDSAGSWKQGGILTGKARKGKDGRKRVKTNTAIPDSFTGGWQTVDTQHKTDDMGKISSAVNTIDQPKSRKNTSPTDDPNSINAEGPALVWPNPQDQNGRDPYDDDNPRQRRDPKPKGKNKKDWRSPPCCESCGGGKWRRCQGGAKKPGVCKYNSLTDCQMLGNPKGNLKPLKLKAIYESKKPTSKRKVIRITESNLKNLIKKALISEQEGKAVNVKPEEFVCDKCRWNGLKTHQLTADGKPTGDILLFLTLFNHTGNDTDRIERFDWEGNVKDERRGYAELKRKADAANKKYGITIKIPQLNGFMEKEEKSKEKFPSDPRRVGKLREQISTSCKPCPSSTRFPAVVNPTCGKRVKCDGRPCGDKDYFGGCCDKAKEGTYKLFNGAGQASCNCYQAVHMSYCK